MDIRRGRRTLPLGDAAVAAAAHLSNVRFEQATPRSSEYSTLNFTAVWGNLGSVRAYDADSYDRSGASGAGAVLYVLVAVNRQEKIHIGAVDAETGALIAASPQISEGGKPLWASNRLLQLAACPTAVSQRTKTVAS